MCGWWLAPHITTMAISSMDVWGWLAAAVASAVGACRHVQVMQRRVVGCGAASQAHLQSGAVAGLGSGLLRVQSAGKKRRLHKPPSAAAFAPGGDHIPTRC